MGLFDHPEACTALLARCGLVGDATAVNYADHRQRELDRLADTLEAHLDTDRLWQLVGS